MIGLEALFLEPSCLTYQVKVIPLDADGPLVGLVSALNPITFNAGTNCN
jgi:hypothetical protein